MMSLSKDRKFKKKEGGGDEVKRERREQGQQFNTQVDWIEEENNYPLRDVKSCILPVIESNISSIITNQTI